MKNQTSKSIGKRIALLRRERKMSQEEFADVSGKMINTISNIERGLSDPKISTLEALSKALKVDIKDLFSTTSEQKTVKPISGSLEAIIKILEHEDEKTLKTALKQIQALLEMK